MNSILKDKIELYIKQIFNRYDVNHDDCLDKAELKHLLQDCLGRFQKQITEDQLIWYYNQIDQDKDGKITFADYFFHFFKMRAQNTLKKLKSAQQSVNQDQLIDLQQFEVLIKQTFKPLKVQITKQMVQWNFNQINSGHTGRITFAQYLAFIKKYNQ